MAKPKTAKKPVKKPAAKTVKAKKGTPEWATPAALMRYDFETQKMTSKLGREVDQIESEYLASKERTGDLKKSLEGREAELRSMIRDRAEYRGKPPNQTLFTKQETAAKQKEMELANAKVASGALPETDRWFPEDLWKQFPIKRLMDFGLTESDVKKIEAGEVKKGEGFPILTMGNLSKFTEVTSGGYSRTFKDLKGIGAAGVDRLQDAHEKFWAAWKNGLDEKFALENNHKKPEPKAEEPAQKATKSKKSTKTEATDAKEAADETPKPVTDQTPETEQEPE